MSEFTGERVIPGQVDDDLWAEHIARYAFAARLAAGKRVLDLGCGTGYGTAELARHATEAVGVDISAEAIEYASSHYPAAHFLKIPATELPFSNACFDLVTSFELIEHLSDYRSLLAQAQRVLHPAGLFVVSTPNKLYYAEARGASGPNPFHEHEFEYAEFEAALREFFPQVRILLQDRLEAFSFYQPGTEQTGDAQILRATADPTSANFFVAICSQESLLPLLPPFVYVPAATNLLRERESHIRKLQAELVRVRKWLDETTFSRDELLARHTELERQADDKALWARQLEEMLHDAQARVVELQEQNAKEQVAASAIVENLNLENLKNIAWAQETGRKLEQHLAEHARTVALLNQAENTVIERTQWAQRLGAELETERARVEMVRQSRWIKLGRTAGLGPKLDA